MSSLRNVLIAESFYLVNEIEKYGSGMIRIRKELEAYPEIDLELSEVGNNFHVVFRKRQEETTKETAKETTKETARKIPEKIIALMREKPDITIQEISDIVGLSFDGVYYHIRRMKERGSIRRKGPTKKGNWEVLEDE